MTAAAAGGGAGGAGGDATSSSSSATSKWSSIIVRAEATAARDGGGVGGGGAGRAPGVASFAAGAGFSAAGFFDGSGGGGAFAGGAGAAAGGADAAPGSTGFNSGGGCPPIQAISSRPGSSMRASHNDIPGSPRSGGSPGCTTFSTTALARKQCLPSLSVAVSRMAVPTGRGFDVRRRNNRELSSGCRARTSSSVAQGSLTCRPKPVFFAPLGEEGSAGPLPLTPALSGDGRTVPRKLRERSSHPCRGSATPVRGRGAHLRRYEWEEGSGSGSAGVGSLAQNRSTTSISVPRSTGLVR